MYNTHESSGESETSWHKPAALVSDPLPARADVVVIGAGIAGLSTAYHLLLGGKSVVVLDKGHLSGGETARTTAHLASAVDERFYVLERMHGQDGARLVRESHAAAIDSIEGIAQREGIACEFSRVDGWLFAADRKRADELEREFAAATRAGCVVARGASAPLPFETGACLRFSNQAQLEPMKYLEGLARAVRARGGVLCFDRHVRQVEEGKGCAVHLQTGASIHAEAVVVATNTPINDVFAMHTKQASYRSYVVAVEIERGSIAPGLFWDTEDPYHYLRLQGDDLLIVGGEDHKSGQSAQPEESWERLERWTRERFPGAGPVRQRWSGHIQEPADGIAFIGRNPGSSRVFIVTGDSGNGMTHGALAGILLTDLICGRENAWSKLYDPSRKVSSLHALRDFLKENVNVALHYGDWLRPQTPSDEAVAPGTGAVIRRGVRPVAVFVDEQGVRHECSAICPHLGAIVAWNRAERSWDCPCHGSRFSPHGEVLTGPATRALAPVTQIRTKSEDERASPPAR